MFQIILWLHQHQHFLISKFTHSFLCCFFFLPPFWLPIWVFWVWMRYSGSCACAVWLLISSALPKSTRCGFKSSWASKLWEVADITEPQEDCEERCCQMARVQLASSVAYLGQLGETCGYGRLVDVDSFFFFFPLRFSFLYPRKCTTSYMFW